MLAIEQRSTNKHWRREINKIPDRPRKEAVSQFRLTTGRDCLAQHLHRFKMVPLPFCTLCNLNEEMDRAHLQKCPALSQQSECDRYWEARRLLMQIEFTNFISPIKSVALQLRRAKTDWNGCCQMALWLAKCYPSTLISVFLTGFRYFSYQAATQLASRGWVDPVPDPIPPEKLLGYSRESNPGPLGWQSDVPFIFIVE